MALCLAASINCVFASAFICCAVLVTNFMSGQCFAGLFGSGCPEGCAAKAQSSPGQREWQSEETEIRQLQVLED